MHRLLQDSDFDNMLDELGLTSDTPLTIGEQAERARARFQQDPLSNADLILDMALKCPKFHSVNNRWDKAKARAQWKTTAGVDVPTDELLKAWYRCKRAGFIEKKENENETAKTLSLNCVSLMIQTRPHGLQLHKYLIPTQSMSY